MANTEKREGRFAPGMPISCEWCCSRLRLEYACGDEDWCFRCPTCSDLTLIFPHRVTDSDEGWVWA